MNQSELNRLNNQQANQSPNTRVNQEIPRNLLKLKGVGFEFSTATE
jgi:hypothetical protein